jgi:hypothetical protein
MGRRRGHHGVDAGDVAVGGGLVERVDQLPERDALRLAPRVQGPTDALGVGRRQRRPVSVVVISGLLRGVG